MQRPALRALPVLSLLLLAGCATLFSGTRQDVYIASEPAGATILVDGLERGTTPTTIRLKKPGVKETEVTLRLAGYADRTFTLQSEFDLLSILNVFFWPGFVIDAVSGAIQEYDPQTYTLTLQRARAETAAMLGVDHLVLLDELPVDASGRRVVPPPAAGIRLGVLDPVTRQAVIVR